MEIIENNSNTIFSKYRIKVYSLYILFLSVSLLILIGLIVLLFIGVKALNDGVIRTEVDSLIYAIFISFLVVLFSLLVGVIVLIIILVLLINRHKKTIKYYQENGFNYVYWDNEFDYDYKVFQTASKNSFHSMVIKMQMDGGRIQRKTRPIYTNSSKIGFVKIPLILQSNSYVNKRVLLGYDKKLDEVVVIDIK